LCIALRCVLIFPKPFGDADVRGYLVVDHKTKKSVVVDLDKASSITRVDQEDIEWAIENEGRCETERYTIAEILVGECNRYGVCERQCDEPLR